jgi:hypothetical protein
MTEPQPNRCLHFIVRHFVMSSQVFLQFGKETKIRRASSGLYDGWSQTVKPSLRTSAVFHKFMCGLALKQRQPVGINFQHTTPLTSLKTVSMILPGDASVLNFFVEEYCLSCPQTAVICRWIQIGGTFSAYHIRTDTLALHTAVFTSSFQSPLTEEVQILPRAAGKSKNWAQFSLYKYACFP